MNAHNNIFYSLIKRQSFAFWLVLAATCVLIFLFFNILAGDFGAGFIVGKWITLFSLFLIVVVLLSVLVHLSDMPAGIFTHVSTKYVEKKPATMYVIRKPNPSMTRILDSNFNIKTADILDQIPNIIWVGDHEGNRIWFNRCWVEFTGHILDQGLALGWVDDIHPDDRDNYREVQKACMAAAQSYSSEYRLKHRDGNYRTIIDYASPIHDEKDRIAGYIGIAIDISERVVAHQKLVTSEEKFSKAFNASPEVVILTRLADGKIIDVNKTFERIMEYDAREAIGKTVEALGLWKDPSQRDIYSKLIEKSGSVREREIHMRAKSGKTVVLFGSSEILQIAGEQCILSSALDITERKAMEDELRQSQHKLQELAAMLTQAEENERRRIAVDLHDKVVQNLGLLKITCGKLSISALSEDAQTILQSISSVVEETITASRTLIHELSPPVLNELGFEAALRWLAEQMSDRYGINYTVKIESVEMLPGDELQSTLFRIARELMTNAGKHSAAKSIHCNFHQVDRCLKLSIADDGRGFNTAEIGAQGVAATGGFGLFSIRQSLERLNGELTILSQPDKGTTISVSIPSD
jgi:PAS domain S-box-containing protein